MINKIIYLVEIALFVFLATATAFAGELDSSFGVDGRVAIEIGTHGDRAQAIVIQPDGKILLGGSSTDGDSLGCSLIRLLADGRPDPSFNGDGTFLFDVSSGDDEILALGLTTEGQILAGGYSNKGADRNFLLLRINSDGTLDTDFGDQGKIITSVGNSNEEITALVVDESGSVLVAGSAEGTRGRVIVLARYQADGSLDTTFADQGVSMIGIGSDVLAQGMVVDQNGRIIISGSYTDGDTIRMMLAGFTPDGLIDDGFGKNGVAVTSYRKDVSEGYGIFQEQKGTIFVAGSVGPEGERDAALFHFSADGIPDNSFGEDGALITEVGPEDDVLYGLAGNTTRLNAGGFTTSNGSRDFLLITYDKYTISKQSEADQTDAQEAENDGTFNIGLLQMEESFSIFETDSVAEKDLLQAEVVTTSFSQGEAMSFAIAMQDDGKVVIVGKTGDYGLTSVAVARYGTASAPENQADSLDSNLYISTNIPTDVNATGAITGGVIQPDLEEEQGASVSQRGVVFSIAPYPVCKDGCSSGGSGGSFVDNDNSSTTIINSGGYTNDGSGSGNFGSILGKLTPDTHYYVRAYAKVGDNIFYGPQVDFETASACFIATAAYGSILHPAVAVLRDFRDQYLKTNKIGRRFVAWYYKNSPPIADKIAASSAFRFITRIALVPLIAVGWALMHPGASGIFLCLVCSSVMLFRLRRRHFVTPLT